MAERTVKVNLVADVSEYTASLARAAAQTRGLSDSVQTEFKRTESNARSSGERAGGTLARGINLGLVRNSPLIVAGLSGALAAGAPAVTAGAVTLFAGIGAAAVSQTAQVRRAWTGLGSFIRDSAAEDAASLVPVFTRMASQLASTFDSLRPQLRAAFEAAAPQIDGLTDSFARAAQVAVPALVRAVQAGAPVMAGLADLVESIGEGIAGFMDAISSHTGAAGTALSAIGDVVGDLLPVLGELLGQGAELASVVLPPLAAVLGVVADVLDRLGPLLPTVAAGFGAFKVAQTLAPQIRTFAAQAQFATFAMTGSATAGQRVGSALAGIGQALPALGVTLGLFTAMMERSNEQAQIWGEALASGGHAAAEARSEMGNFGTAMETTNSGFGGFIANMAGFGAATGNTVNALEGAKEKSNELKDAMTPLEAAQQNFRVAQEALNTAINTYGQTSPQAVAASGAFRAAQAEVEYQEGLTATSIDGVTQAMIDQYNQALAATNSAYAYRDSQNAVEDAQAHLLDVQSHLNDSNAATRTSTEDVSRAGLQLEEALMREAGAAGQLAADALPATASELDRTTASAQGTLAELYRMRDEMGGAFPASLQTTIANLENTGVHVDTTSGQFNHLSDTVNNVPVFHNIHVAADLGPAEASLNNFINKHWSAIISTNVQGSGGTGGSSTGGGRRVLAAGGRVSGPGGPTSDSIPAMLSDGEFVVNAVSTTRHLGLLQALNARRGFADGGLASKDWTKIVYNADLTGAEAGMLSARKSAGAAVMAVPVGAAGAGVARWSGLVLQALSMMGQPASLLGTVLRRMNQESGGNPNAINLWDVNAKRGTPSIGLMQTIGPTFRAYHDPRSSSNIYDPLANVLASMRYALSRYGSLSAAYNRRGGYETGTDFVPETGPAVLHKGEAVLTREQGEAYRAGLRSREVAGVGSSGAGGAVTVNIGGARIAGTLDLGGGLEARIDGRIVDALTTQTTWGAYQR